MPATRQPVPAPLPSRDTWSVALLADTKGAYPTLSPLAARMRLPFAMATSASLLINRVPVSLALDIDSGSVRAVRVTADFEVPPGTEGGPYLKLRKETPADRADKASQTSVEVQVGVKRFDDDIYIDSNAADSEVRRVLSRPETRTAVQRLLTLGTDLVELTCTNVSVKLSAQGGDWRAEQLLDVLEQLLVVVRGGGPRGAATPRHGEGLVSAAALGFAVSLAVVFFCVALWGAGFFFGAATWGLCGALGAWLVRPFVRPLVAGDSGSGARLRSVLALAFLCGADLGLSGVLALNAVDGTELRTPGHVTSVGTLDSENDTWDTDVRWDDGRSESFDLHWLPHAGERVELLESKGVFVRWNRRVRSVP